MTWGYFSWGVIRSRKNVEEEIFQTEGKTSAKGTWWERLQRAQGLNRMLPTQLDDPTGAWWGRGRVTRLGVQEATRGQTGRGLISHSSSADFILSLTRSYRKILSKELTAYDLHLKKITLDCRDDERRIMAVRWELRARDNGHFH